MKRWTNGLPGATKRLGAKMALRGLAASESWVRADTHDGPEQIAPLQRPDTLMQLSRSSILEVHLVQHGRAIQFGTSALSIACEISGPENGLPVILLHGWPDDARTWDRVLPALHAVGRQTYVPYLRGVGPTRFRDPSTARSGQLSALGQDVIDL